MKRIVIAVLLLSAVCLLAGCGPQFELDADGYGLTDTKNDVHYVLLPEHYEAARAGEKIAERSEGEPKDLYKIPSLDSEVFLADNNGYVYCAEGEEPDASEWELDRVLICDEDMVSVAISEVTDTEALALLHRTWFEGEATEFPFGESHVLFHRLKMSCAEYPNLYFCVSFYLYEDGSGYLYDIGVSRRVVACPPELCALFD